MKKMVQTVVVLVLILAVAIGSYLYSNGDHDDNEKIGIRGIVTNIVINGDEGTILVEGEIETDTMYDKALVRITQETLIQKDNMSRLFEIADIEEGTTVEVIFKGAVAESHPVQGTAAVVRMITGAN